MTPSAVLKQLPVVHGAGLRNDVAILIIFASFHLGSILSTLVKVTGPRPIPDEGVHVSATESTAIPARHFRDVLGQFPTGVAVVTAIGADDAPVGMTVGTFTSVSIEPPLVAFLPDASSSTFPTIRDAGRFCVNVLAGDQESIGLRFASRGEDRFNGISWAPGIATGSPVLDGALASIECEIETIHEAGDHYIVIGAVKGLDVHKPTLPMVFFQGGFGTFAPRSLVLASQREPSEAVRFALESRERLEELSATLGLESRLLAVQDEHLVIVATSGYEGLLTDPVGVIMPFFPPFGATIPAWNPDLRDRWFDAFPGELDEAARAAALSALDAIRERGWTFTFRSEAQVETAELVAAMVEHGRTPQLERRLMAVGVGVRGLADPQEINEDTAREVRTISAPIVCGDGVVMHLTLYGFDGTADAAGIAVARDGLLEVSRDLSARFSGSIA